MKNLKRLSTALLVTIQLSFSAFNTSAQNIGINPTGAAPDNSALLDLSSADKGFLITRVDTANIAAPAFGLMTLSPMDSCLYMYSGNQWMSIGGVGTNCGNASGPVTPPSVNVTSVTGETWMDRNLGASQVATSSTDAAAYGDLYQWGRLTDGHEKRTSAITNTISPGTTPGHGDFISHTSTDWIAQNDNLWQGVAGINNPCPTGFRLPTLVELDAERATWSSNDDAGAFASPLKLTVAGSRNYYDGALASVGGVGQYWTSTTNQQYSHYMYILPGQAGTSSFYRGNARSVRCIMD